MQQASVSTPSTTGSSALSSAKPTAPLSIYLSLLKIPLLFCLLHSRQHQEWDCIRKNLTSRAEMCFSLWASSVFPACLFAWAGSCRGVTAVGKLPSGPSYTGKPLPDPTHRQTPTNSNSPLSPPTPSPLFSAHCFGFTSLYAIGLTAVHSPHLPTGIGYRLFPFLYGQGQGCLGCGVL